MKPLQFAVLLAVTACFTSQAVAQSNGGPFKNGKRSVRSRDVDQRHVRLELTFDLDKRQFRGRAVLTLSPFKAIQRLSLDAADMKIEKVMLSGDKPSPLKFTTKAGKLNIELGRKIAADTEFNLQIDYRVSNPTHGAHFVVPDKNEPNQPKMVWTQSEPEYARFWFPCIDSPTDRITSEIIATVPKKYFVLSNGALKSKKLNADGTQTWHWQQRKTHVPYLMSVVAGDFEAYEQTWGGIPIVSYVPRGRLADAPRSFEKTPAMMKLFTEKIGFRYPWPKYAQICVDEYNWGGMEHTSATTLNLGTLHDERAHDDVSSDNLVAHELAHQWFGDLMTCKDWGELWLNESFATFFATLWTEHDKGKDEAVWQRYGEGNSYRGEDKRYRRAIVNYRYNAPGNMFDRHSYPKGGRVLNMLRYELGDELFWRAIRRYCEVNQFRTVETADFRRAIEDASGQGLNWFFDQWIHKGGHPDFKVDWQWDEETKTARVTVKQTQKVDDLTPLFRTSLDLQLATPDETLMRRVTVSKAEETFHFTLKQRPTRVCFDPNDWILKTLVFEKSKEELLDQLAHDDHIICRVRAVQGLAKYKKDADVRRALSQAVQSDKFWAVRQEAVKVLAKLNGDEIRDALLQVAQSDAKSAVRREAIRALGKFKGDTTKTALRKTIANDRSYFAVADALRALLKVDRDGCKADMMAALKSSSYREVVMQAACDCLINLKEETAAAAISGQLAGSISPQRRVQLTVALARLQPDDAKARTALNEQLDNERRNVRSAAINALVALGDPAGIEVLQSRRGKEASLSTLRALDEAIEKLRGKQTDLKSLRDELEKLRKQNRRLEERLKKLEKTTP